MVQVCATIKRVLRSILNNTLRKFPSKYHASKWPMVERALCIRSIVMMLFLVAFEARVYSAKNAHHD